MSEEQAKYGNQEQPYRSIGAWIPATLLYNKEITPRQKLLFAVIHNLCNDRGYCWAGNEYFAKEFEVSKDRITKDIKALKAANYIITFTEITPTGSRRIIKETSGGVSVNTEGGISVNADHKKININSNGKSEDLPSSLNVGIDENGQLVQTSPLEPELKQILREDNPKALRKCPKSVDGKTVTSRELDQVSAYWKQYNYVRGLYMDKDSSMQFDAKACRECVDAVRQGEINVDGYNYLMHYLFMDEYHKSNHWRYITPEFSFRQTTLNKYYDEAERKYNEGQ